MPVQRLSLADACEVGVLDAHDQAALLARGELRPSDLVEAAILRIEAFDGQLAALSYRAFAMARERAAHLGAVHDLVGVPYLLKDSLDYPGMPSLGGSRSRSGVLARAGYPFAQRFDERGLIPLGKTAMPEFGFMASTEPLLTQRPTRNPWMLAHSPGGSSGGAAAAVAAGLAPLAHGSDGAGSIRIPASCCGIVGLKPSRGAVVRVRSRHVFEDILVTDSLMSRSVRDVAWAFAAAHPQKNREMLREPSKQRLRVAVIESSLSGSQPDDDVKAAIRSSVAACERLGHRVEAAELPVDGAAVMEALLTLFAHMAADTVDAMLLTLGGRRLEDALEPWTLDLAQRGREISTDALERAYAQFALLPTQMAKFYLDYDVLLSPVVRTPPPLIGTYAPDRPFEELRDGMYGWISYTPLQNLAGNPAISLPLHWNAEGLPVGVMFSADRDGDDRLLSLAYELEETAQWKTRWPAVSAKAWLRST